MWPIAFLLLLLCFNADARPKESVRHRITLRTRSPDGRTQSPDRRPMLEFDRSSTQEKQGFFTCMKQCWERSKGITNIFKCMKDRCCTRKRNVEESFSHTKYD
ncbi:unnamed protein product [Cylicocyclus nassatus]|uniref:Uncharacterized protein n=1 Tax=Cylicocyclus nassatus TaxID=53992 RepID=A0AA36GSG2_CYLNA|nr:unnamed protein product [Cylicocyclus nassatus]